MSESQFSLFKTRRFAPFFFTQFLGAFNDNVFKNVLLLMIAYGLLKNGPSEDEANVWTNFSALCFILPFFLFSAFAGQISDKYDKQKVLQKIKCLEIVIMGMATLAFYFDSFYGLMAVLFCMGAQSAFFSPAKYSIIPQHLKEEELIGGNALIELGTFLAILLGFIVANLLAQLENAPLAISMVVLVVAVIGYLTSRSIPSAPSLQPEMIIDKNPFRQTVRIIGFARADRTVWLSILGVSWFWFLGAAYLTQLPNYTRVSLSSSSDVVTLLLCMFSIGIGLGSMLCDRLSGHKIEIGIVPLGSIGLTIFGVDLYFASQLPDADSLRSLAQFYELPQAWRVSFDLVMLGVFGGFYIVPLYALIQQNTEPETRAQVISAANIMNALFMVLSALSGTLILGMAGLSIAQFFLWLAIVNMVVALYIYCQVPIFSMRFLIWMVTHTMYRVTAKHLDRIPDSGAAVIICNHVSYVDALLIGGACRRPIRFIMYQPIYKLPVLNFIFRTGRAIPIMSQHKNKEVYENAFKEIKTGLEAGDLLAIFPEGKLTSDGEIGEFKTGIEKILAVNPVPVIPMALKGLWGSYFSHKDGHALTTRPKRFWSKVELDVGELVPPEQAKADHLRSVVATLRGDQP